MKNYLKPISNKGYVIIKNVYRGNRKHVHVNAHPKPRSQITYPREDNAK